MAFTGVQPGTRITGSLDESSSIWTYVKQACVGALAIDLVLACVMIWALLMGWLSVPFVFVIVGFLVGWTIVKLVRLDRNDPDRRLAIACIMGTCLFLPFVVGLGWGQQIWRWLLLGSVREVIGQAVQAATLPWWTWLIELVLWFLSAWKRRGKLVGSVLVLGTLGYIGYSFEGWGLLPHIWSRARWALIPFLWPVIGFALFLAIVMVKEMCFPNLEWTLRPVSLEEVREIGLAGLWFPYVLGGPAPEPLPDRYVKVEVAENGGKSSRIGLLPDSAEARAFYAAVYHGEPFALRTARKYSVSRKTFEDRIRDVFFDREWAEWIDPEHHEQGIDVFPVGMLALEHLSMAGSPPYPS